MTRVGEQGWLYPGYATGRQELRAAGARRGHHCPVLFNCAVTVPCIVVYETTSRETYIFVPSLKCSYGPAIFVLNTTNILLIT